MNYDQLRQMLSEHFRKLLNERKAAIAESGRLSPQDRAGLESDISLAQTALVTGTPYRVWEANDENEMQALMQHLSIDFTKGSVEYQWLRDEWKTAHRDYMQAVLQYDKRLDTYDFATPERSSVPVQASGAAPAAKKGISLEKMISSFLAEKKLGDMWAAKTEIERTDHLDLLIELLGKDTDARGITADDAMSVKEVLQKYPKNRSKNRVTRELSLNEALAANQPTIQVKTMNTYLQTYSDLFEWGANNKHIDQNMFSGSKISQNRKRVPEDRTSYSGEQIRLILETLIDNRLGMVRMPHYKWGSLIGVYTGARLNEICQMHLSDIRREDNIWYFDLNDGDGTKKLKNKASRREVPMHQRLIDLGLLEYIDGLRADGHTKLFPTLTYDPSNGWGRSVGRWFNEKLLPDLGIKSKQLVFHSLRHTVITTLLQSGADEQIVKAIVGHTRKGVTQQVYFGKGYTLSQLNNEMQKLDFG